MSYQVRDDIAGASCMGGWCPVRNGCALYLAKDRSEPQERMCAKGYERVVPVILPRRAEAVREGA